MFKWLVDSARTLKTCLIVGVGGRTVTNVTLDDFDRGQWEMLKRLAEPSKLIGPLV